MDQLGAQNAERISSGCEFETVARSCMQFVSDLCLLRCEASPLDSSDSMKILLQETSAKETFVMAAAGINVYTAQNRIAEHQLKMIMCKLVCDF